MRMKLALQLVPRSSFYSNLRNMLGPKRWSNLSQKIRGENNFTCQYCGWQEETGVRRYTHLHEVWDYDDENRIQKLVGFECLCPDCHNVHHWMFAESTDVDMTALLEHACDVNNCMEMDFENHVRSSVDEWSRRSGMDWKLDLGEWKGLVE